MLDGNDSCHAVPDIGTGIVDILVLQNTKLSGVSVDDLRKGRLESGQMRAALRVVNVVAEAHDFLTEIPDILKRAFFP